MQFGTPLRTRRFWVAGLGLLLVSGCQPAPPTPVTAQTQGAVVVYVASDGWHTDLALPASAISAPLQNLMPEFPTADYLRFGWGEQDYYMARHPTAGDALRALFPGPAVLLVTPLHARPMPPPAGSQIFVMGLTIAGAGRLADYLWGSFDRSNSGELRPLAAGPSPGSVFYAATGRYSAAYTCNTWTAAALRAAGIQVNSAGVVFAGQLTRQLHALPVQ